MNEEKQGFGDLRLVVESAEIAATRAALSKAGAGEGGDRSGRREVIDRAAESAARDTGVDLSPRALRLVQDAAEVMAERALASGDSVSSPETLSPRELLLVIDSAEAGAAVQLSAATRKGGRDLASDERWEIVDTAARNTAAAAAGSLRLRSEDIRLVVMGAETANPPA